jgi:hypothetical protein
MMFAEQGCDDIGVIIALGPDHLTRAIGRLRCFSLHS